MASDIQTTHFADDATLSRIAALERDLSAARAEIERLRKDAERPDVLADVRASLWVAVSHKGHHKYTTDRKRAEGWKASPSIRWVHDYYRGDILKAAVARERKEVT